MANESRVRSPNDNGNGHEACEVIAHMNDISIRQMRNILSVVIEGVQVAAVLNPSSAATLVTKREIAELIANLNKAADELSARSGGKSLSTARAVQPKKAEKSVANSMRDIVQNAMLMQRSLDAVSIASLGMVTKLLLASAGGNAKGR